MYSFEPSEEQQMLIDAINRYAVNDLRMQAHDADEEGQLPPDLVEKGWELGFLQASIPEDYGGFGERSVVTGVLAAEEMAYGDLAGALGVPVWLVLPDVPEWRWMMDRNDSPWYPTMRLFRQPGPGDWKSVFQQVADEMRKLEAQHNRIQTTADRTQWR